MVVCVYHYWQNKQQTPIQSFRYIDLLDFLRNHFWRMILCVYISKKSQQTTHNETPPKKTTKTHKKPTKKKEEKSHPENLVAFLIRLHPSMCRDKWCRAASPVLFWFSPLWVTGKVRWEVDSTGKKKHLSEDAGKGKESGGNVPFRVLLNMLLVMECPNCLLDEVKEGKKPHILLL